MKFFAIVLTILNLVSLNLGYVIEKGNNNNVSDFNIKNDPKFLKSLREAFIKNKKDFGKPNFKDETINEEIKKLNITRNYNEVKEVVFNDANGVELCANTLCSIPLTINFVYNGINCGISGLTKTPYDNINNGVVDLVGIISCRHHNVIYHYVQYIYIKGNGLKLPITSYSFKEEVHRGINHFKTSGGDLMLLVGYFYEIFNLQDYGGFSRNIRITDNRKCGYINDELVLCNLGECCSKKGYCGDTDAYCSFDKGCQSDYGHCQNEIIDYSSEENGRCGSYNGKGCKLGCCSQKGYCGQTNAHCQTGCQYKYGSCFSSYTNILIDFHDYISSTTTKSTAKKTTTKSSKTTSKTSATDSGRCGPSVNVKCPNGYCCSKYGYCGKTSEYCGTGCLKNYGKCNN